MLIEDIFSCNSDAEKVAPFGYVNINVAKKNFLQTCRFELSPSGSKSPNQILGFNTYDLCTFKEKKKCLAYLAEVCQCLYNESLSCWSAG